MTLWNHAAKFDSVEALSSWRMMSWVSQGGTLSWTNQPSRISKVKRIGKKECREVAVNKETKKQEG